MFALEQIPDRFRRIGIGFAVAALSVTSFVTPLSASAHEIALPTTVMAISQTDDPIPAPTVPATATRKADVKVVARGKTQAGGTTKYHFVIVNNGPANSGPFNWYKEGRMSNGSDYQLTDNGYFPMSLAAGQEQMVSVTCAPPAGFSCVGANVIAVVSNLIDPNLSNNSALLN